MNKKIIIILILLTILIGFILVHESVHSLIYSYYGCNDINFNINKKGIYTTCNDLDYKYTEINILAHSINEIIGYTFIYLFMMFMCFYLIKE